MDLGIKIFAIVAILVIRLIIMAARKKNAANATAKPQPNYNKAQMKQPPPFTQPSSNTNPFQSTNNPFTNTPTPPSFTDPFDEKQDAFSNIPKHNTTSNMGVGSQNYYCMYCGKKFQTVAALKMDTCFKHPKSDQGLQKHVLYTGAGKPNIGF
ncbi:hypothetical protein BH09BAC5_BH09BAC5_06330 [soil metagenome]